MECHTTGCANVVPPSPVAGEVLHYCYMRAVCQHNRRHEVADLRTVADGRLLKDTDPTLGDPAAEHLSTTHDTLKLSKAERERLAYQEEQGVQDIMRSPKVVEVRLMDRGLLRFWAAPWGEVHPEAKEPDRGVACKFVDITPRGLDALRR